MSYTYLQGQEVESSEVYCWDIDPCALLSSMPMPGVSCLPDKKMDCSQDFQSGTMFAHLMESHGEGKPTLSVGVSHAKISAVQEKGQDSMVKKVVFGERCNVLFMRYDRNTSSLKTHHCLWEEDLQQSSVTLPRWGMTQDGVFLEQAPLVVGIYEKGAGCWPTPLKEEGPGGKHKKLTDAVAIAEGYRPRYYNEPGTEGKEAFTGSVNPEWAEWLMGWPMGWTNVCQELEMGKFLLWQQQHGLY